MGKLRMAKLGKSATHLLALAEEHDSPKLVPHKNFQHNKTKGM